MNKATVVVMAGAIGVGAIITGVIAHRKSRAAELENLKIAWNNNS